MPKPISMAIGVVALALLATEASAQFGAGQLPPPYESQLYRICAVHSGKAHCRLTYNRNLIMIARQRRLKWH